MWTVRTKDRAWRANQNWLLGEHGASLFPRLSHRQTDRQIDRQDRQTQGRMRVIVMFCQNDSFDLLSFSPQPLTEGLCHLDKFRLTNKFKCPLLQLYSLTHVFQLLLWFLSSSVCLSLFTSSCLSVDLTPISLSPPTLSSFSWWFIRLYSTCCYVWQNGDGRLLGAVTWIHSHIKYPPD